MNLWNNSSHNTGNIIITGTIIIVFDKNGCGYTLKAGVSSEMSEICVFCLNLEVVPNNLPIFFCPIMQLGWGKIYQKIV